AFFDYYVRFIRQGFDTAEAEIAAWTSLTFRGRMLIPALAMYLPARLGITPSSAQKMYEEHVELVEILTIGKRLRAYFSLNLNNAYPNTVPEDLRQYIFYDENQDAQATRGLLGHYRPEKNPGSVEENQAREQVVQEFLRSTKPRLTTPLRNAGRLSYPVESDNTPIARVTIIEPYAHSTIFILNLKNGSHLTVEIGADGSVYGIPLALYRQFPHIEDVLIPDILRTIHIPERIKEAAVTSNMRSFIPRPLALPSREVAVEQIPHAPKKHVLRRFIPIEIIAPDSEQLPQQTEAVKHFIFYSEESVRELLGSKKRDPNTIKKAMDMLFRFERGWKEAKPLHTNAKDPRELGSLVTGDTRIVVEHLGNNNYRTVVGGDRDDIYKGL
ncbi:MAG: hypothetical protein ACHQT7_02325, partial [Candidatus Levyibacteriota bacterium]